MVFLCPVWQRLCEPLCLGINRIGHDWGNLLAIETRLYNVLLSLSTVQIFVYSDPGDFLRSKGSVKHISQELLFSREIR